MQPPEPLNAPEQSRQQFPDAERLQLLDLLVEALADGFLDWQLEAETVYYSQRLKLILGYEDEEMPSKPWAWLEMTHPEDRALVATELEGLMSGVWPFDLTFRMRHRDTGWRWMRARATAGRDDLGNATRVVVAFSDVTAQVRAERRQMGLINAVPDLLIRVQNDSTIVQVKVPEDLVGGGAELPRLGERLRTSAFASGWGEKIEEAINSALKERRATRFETKRIVSGDSGGTTDIEVRVIPSSDDESLIVIRDISVEKHQREQGLQSQKLEAIGQLAAGIAHEINTPLQFVGDNLHFLAEAADALTLAIEQYRSSCPLEVVAEFDRVDQSLDIGYMTSNLKPAFLAALDGVHRVSVIVQAMKSFSHPGPKEKRAEDLNQAIETTIIISTNVWKYVAEIERDFGANLPKVECVIGEINQVLLNLITNAAHAIGDVVGETGAKGTIRISTRHEGDAVEVAIADSGSGIPDAVRERIFEPFFTTKGVGKGTGQGLPLARAIVLQHRGTLAFETQVGKGTVFRLHLPVSSAPAKPPQP